MSIKAKDGNLNALHDLATQVRAALGDGSIGARLTSKTPCVSVDAALSI